MKKYSWRWEKIPGQTKNISCCWKNSWAQTQKPEKFNTHIPHKHDPRKICKIAKNLKILKKSAKIARKSPFPSPYPRAGTPKPLPRAPPNRLLDTPQNPRVLRGLLGAKTASPDPPQNPRVLRSFLERKSAFLERFCAFLGTPSQTRPQVPLKTLGFWGVSRTSFLARFSRFFCLFWAFFALFLPFLSDFLLFGGTRAQVG